MTAVETILTQVRANESALGSLDSTNVTRLFHGRGRLYEGLEQIAVDRYDGVLWITLFEPHESEFLSALCDALKAFYVGRVSDIEGCGLQGFCIQGIGIQRRYEKGAPAEVVYGEIPEQLVVEEEGLQFTVRLGRNQNTGFFLDMAEGRRWLANHVAGKRVLNLFAYTCAFSVVAAAKGAKDIVNLDMSTGSLNVGRENHRLNNLNQVPVKYLSHDLFRSWGKLKKLGPFDLVILDPPSFQRGSFTTNKDYGRVVRRLPEVLAAGGEVLACLNSPQHDSQFLLDLFAEHAPSLKWQGRIQNPISFKDTNEESALKVHHFVAAN